METASRLPAPAGLPPGPCLPSGRIAQLWIEQPVEFWEDCAAKYGEMFTIQLGSLGTTVLFCGPEAVRQIFQLPSNTFDSRHFNEHYKYVMGAGSILLTDGADTFESEGCCCHCYIGGWWSNMVMPSRAWRVRSSRDGRRIARSPPAPRCTCSR